LIQFVNLDCTLQLRVCALQLLKVVRPMTVLAEAAGLNQVVAAFDFQISWCRVGNAPFTADILELCRDNIASGGALAPLVVPWRGNLKADAVSLRVAGALHFLVRTGRAADLASFYPPHGRAAFDHVAVAREIETAVRANLDIVRDTISRPPQTNEVGRSAVLMPGYAEIARRTGLPLRVLELGASAGLNLNWDRYAYRYGEHFVGARNAPLTVAAEWRGPWSGVSEVPRVAERRGCDRSPIDLAQPFAAERLISYVWPEQAERLARLEGAIALAKIEKPPIDAADAGAWLEKQLAASAPRVATVVAHTIVWQYFSKETAARAEAAINAAGARATSEAPFAWLSLEQYAQDQAPELRLTLWPGGERALLARAHPHGAWLEWVAPTLSLPGA